VGKVNTVNTPFYGEKDPILWLVIMFYGGRNDAYRAVEQAQKAGKVAKQPRYWNTGGMFLPESLVMGNGWRRKEGRSWIGKRTSGAYPIKKIMSTCCMPGIGVQIEYFCFYTLGNREKV
jgi:hypothetical protein